MRLIWKNKGGYRVAGKSERGNLIFEYTYTDPQTQAPTTVMLERIYKDKSGNYYYQFVNPAQMTAERAIAGSLAEAQFGWNLTAEDLISELKKIHDALNAKDYVKAGAICVDLEMRATKLRNDKTILELAATYFLIEGEKPELYLRSNVERKLKIWTADDAARSFFLKYVVDTLRLYGDLSWDDLENSLEKESPKGPKIGAYNLPK